MGPAATAALDPGPRCQVRQLQAASAFFDKSFKCRARYHKDLASDPIGARVAACLEKADAKLLAAFDAALAKAGTGVCGREDGPAFLADLQLDLDTLSFVVSEGNLGLTRAEGRLHASLQKALGKALGTALAAEIRYAKKGDAAKRAAKREKARFGLLAAFDKALAKATAAGIAYPGSSAQETADEVDRIADELASLTAPVGSTSYTLTGSIFASAGAASDSDVNDS